MQLHAKCLTERGYVCLQTYSASAKDSPASGRRLTRSSASGWPIKALLTRVGRGRGGASGEADWLEGCGDGIHTVSTAPGFISRSRGNPGDSSRFELDPEK